MSKLRLVCVPLLVLGGISTCSVERITFPGIDLPIDDASLGDDAQLADALPVADTAGPTDDGPAIDGPAIDGPPAALGTRENPARDCAELHDAGAPSAVAWVRHPDAASPPLEVYCEQLLNGGGWAMLENSVRHEDGTTAAFWQFPYAERLSARGTLDPGENYYNGALYLIGRVYMDVFVNLQDKTAVAIQMTAIGFDAESMRFAMPEYIGDTKLKLVYDEQFAAGWSALDFDGDPLAENCATIYGDIAQHYGTCWYYNLAADSRPTGLDGGVGPHVYNPILDLLGLAHQPGGGDYSQVKRIARFTRW